MSLLKKDLCLYFSTDFYKNFKRSRLLLYASDNVKFVLSLLDFLTQKGLKRPRTQLQTTKVAKFSADTCKSQLL